MKKTSVFLIFLCVILLGSALTACSRELESAAADETGQQTQEATSGKTNSFFATEDQTATEKIDTQPPGTLPDVSELPEADQTLVGMNISLTLELNQKGGCTFCYYYDGEKEWLAVSYPQDDTGCLLGLYQVELGGADVLFETIAAGKSFRVSVLAMKYISFLEAMYTRQVAYGAVENMTYYFAAEQTPSAKGCFVGCVGTDTMKLMKGGDPTTVPEELSTAFTVFYKIFDRFDLTQYIK